MKTRIKSIFNNELLKKGLNDTSYYMIANIGSKALGFLVIPILTRSVSVEDFANYDLFLIISSFIQVVVTLGIDSGIAILMAESKDDHQKLSFYYVCTLLISVVFLIGLMLIFSCIYFFFNESFLMSHEFWISIGLYVLFSVITYHTFNFLRWQTKAKQASFLNLFTYISGAIIGIVLLYFQKEVISYIYGLVIGGFLGSLIGLYISKDYIKSFKVLDNSKELLKELFKISLPFVPNYVANNFMQMSDRLVILMLFSKYELGLYAVIMRLAQIPHFIATTITGGFLPVMYNNYKSENGVKLIRNFFYFYITMIPILFIIFYFLADWAVLIFGGEEYLNVSYLLPMALASILFVNGTQGIGFGYVIARKTYLIMYVTFFSVVLNFILSILFGWLIGFVGVFLGSLMAGIFRVYIHNNYSEELYSFGYNIKYFLFISFIVWIMSYCSYLSSVYIVKFY